MESDTQNLTEINNSSDMEAKLPELVIQLRKLMLADKNLPANYRTDFDFLSIFIRVRAYNVERANVAIQRSLKYMEHNKKVFQGVKPSPDLEIGFEKQFYCPLKGRHDSGAAIILMHAGSWNPSDFPFKIAFASAGYIAQESICQKENQIHGSHFIFNLEGLSFQHIRQLTPTELKLTANSLQGGFPVKVAGIHFVNYPSIFSILYSAAYGFLSAKLRKRIHFHNKKASLHEHFSPDVLPKELGGKLTKDEAIDDILVKNILARNGEFREYFFN